MNMELREFEPLTFHRFDGLQSERSTTELQPHARVAFLKNFFISSISFGSSND